MRACGWPNIASLLTCSPPSPKAKDFLFFFSSSLFPGMTSAPPLDMRVVFTLGLVAATAASGAPGAMRLRGGGFNALVDMPGIQPRAAT